MKKLSVKATRTEWTPTTLNLIGKDGVGRDVEVQVHIESLPYLNTEARRRMAASKVQSQRHTAMEGPYVFLQAAPVRTIDAGQFLTTDGETIALTFDQGLDTEMSFRLSFQHAEELGRLLLSLRPTGSSQSGGKLPS